MVEKQILDDIAIIGCGPAGLSAAINAKIRNKKIKIFGGDVCSPRLAHAPTVDNYLGFHGVKGVELRDKFIEHSNNLGIEIVKGRVDNILPHDGIFSLTVRNGVCQAKTVILAIGIPNNKYLPGEEKLVGLGVSYCATCDGPLFSGKKVALLAYTDEALEEANFLSEICQEVYFFHLYEGKTDKLKDNIQIMNTKPQAIQGEQLVNAVVLEDSSQLTVDGVFVIRPSVPPEQLVPGLTLEGNDIQVNKTMETNIPGLYAAGDCIGKPWQLAKAVGEGQTAALQAVKFLENH